MVVCVIDIVMHDQAADLNFPPAIFNLGVMYMEGKGTPRGMPSIHVGTLLSELRYGESARVLPASRAAEP